MLTKQNISKAEIAKGIQKIVAHLDYSDYYKLITWIDQYCRQCVSEVVNGILNIPLTDPYEHKDNIMVYCHKILNQLDEERWYAK